MSHPSDRRSDGPADRRVERMPDRSADRAAQRRQEGRGGSPGEGRPTERRRAGPQDRPFGAAGASRWGSAAWRGRPGAASGEERPAGPGGRDRARSDRPAAAAGGRRIFRDGPRRAPRGDFPGAGERGGSFAERRDSFSERRDNFAERRGGPRDRGAPERAPGGERLGERGPGEREGTERRGGEWRGSSRSGGWERGGDRGGGDRGGGPRSGSGVRWPGASPGRFPGSRRPERPARPRLPLRLQPGRPSLFAAAAAPAAAPLEAEAESHAPAAPADLIWGRHSALAALEAGRPLHRIWCTSELRFSPKFLQLLKDAKASGVLLEEVTWARLGQISGGAVHQGIVLQPAAAATLQLDSLIEGCRQLGESPLLIAVDGLTDPQNLGAIVRSAEALGAHGLVLPQRRNAGLTGSVAKVAAGALEHLPVARVVNLNRSLDALKQEGYRVIGLASEGTVTLEEADLSGPLVLVTGSEAEGLALLTRRSCDQLVRIPLRGTTPSLNASVATALLLYEVARRSWMAGLRGTAPAPRLERPALPELAPAAGATAPELEGASGEPEADSVGAEAAAPELDQGPDRTDLDAAQEAGRDAADTLSLESSLLSEPAASARLSETDPPPTLARSNQSSSNQPSADQSSANLSAANQSSANPPPSASLGTSGSAATAVLEAAAALPDSVDAASLPNSLPPCGEEDDGASDAGMAQGAELAEAASQESPSDDSPSDVSPSDDQAGDAVDRWHDPSLPRHVPAASTPSLDATEATPVASANAGPFTAALASPGASPGAGTGPSPLSAAPGPAGQEDSVGTTPEVPTAFDQDVSL